MRTRIATWMTVAALAAVGWAWIGFSPQKSPAAPDQSEARRAEERLIAHEWGTFTSFSGSDGIQLEFRSLTSSDLPEFIPDLEDYARYSREWEEQDNFDKRFMRSHQRMETPVVYFYTGQEREVNVRVDFPQGLLTEFYPPPKEIRFAKSYYDKHKKELGDAFLSWEKVRLIPPSQRDLVRPTGVEGVSAAPELPVVPDGNPYGFARNTDSALVEVDGPPGVGKQYEKFLFYRGIGNFKAPVKMLAEGDGRFGVFNYGNRPLGAAFLLEAYNGWIRFASHPALAPHDSMYLESAGEWLNSPDTLMAEMAKALVSAGLYEAEAQSMVNTWRDSWFGENGTRLLYLLPRELTDELLPIKIEPAPDELTRVMVGRMEIMTPEVAQRLTTAIQASEGESPSTEAVQAELAQLGRFAEPALEYLKKSHASDPMAPTIDKLLVSLRPSDEKVATPTE